MYRKIVLWNLLLCLTFFIVGCGSIETKSTDTTPTKKASETKRTEKKKTVKEDYAKYKDTVSSYEDELNKPLLSYLSDWLSTYNDIQDMIDNNETLDTVPIKDVDDLINKSTKLEYAYNTNTKFPENVPADITYKLSDFGNLYSDVIEKSNKYMTDYKCFYSDDCSEIKSPDDLETDLNQAIDAQNSYTKYTNNMNKLFNIDPITYYAPSKIVPPEDPQIGMTEDEAKASSWGEPESINKTTTAGDVSEQWVYPGYKYLYFDNGKLTAIQD